MTVYINLGGRDENKCLQSFYVKKILTKMHKFFLILKTINISTCNNKSTQQVTH